MGVIRYNCSVHPSCALCDISSKVDFSCSGLVGVCERALLRCSGGTNLSAAHQHLFLQQETDCRGWRRCTAMFVCYIPGERASLCYTAGVLLLSHLAEKFQAV